MDEKRAIRRSERAWRLDSIYHTKSFTDSKGVPRWRVLASRSIAQAEQSPVVGHAVGQVGQVLRIAEQHAVAM
jgi:hypothetical protein